MNSLEKEAFSRQNSYSIDDLLALTEALRAEDGCAWDRAQTHASIRRCLLEEAYEAAEAIDRDDPAMLREELGDLLFQIVFHAQIESEKGNFTFSDVADGVSKKMVERHPHVFAHPGSEAPDWNEQKRLRRGQTKLSERLDEIPAPLPALMRADKLIDRMAQVGSTPEDYPASETKPALPALPKATDSAAAGDILLAFVAECRSAGIDCERALSDACARLVERVKSAEQAGDVHK